MSDAATLNHPDLAPYEEGMGDDDRVNILIVDDLPEKLLVYEVILEEMGQRLITVNSGEEALKMVLRHEFAVILLDVNMPGMDGFETATLIRQRKRSAHTPIIFLTAFTDEVRMSQGYATGAVDYLPTPVVPEILKAKVKVFIELFQMRRQAALQAEEKARRTAAEEAARRSIFLGKAIEILARSQSQVELARTLARLAHPLLADVSMVWLPGDDATGQRMEWAWTDEQGQLGSEPVALDPPVAESLNKTLQHIVATGQLQHISDLPFSRLSSVADADGAALPALDTALLVPLTVRGQIQGVLLLGRKSESGPYRPDEMSLASDLALRAGVALENALLMEKIQDADRRKDEFLGMLAHELRNPLGPIRNAAQLLHMLGPKEPRLEQVRDIVDRQVAHMARLIDDLLDTTRLARGNMLLRKERCDLSKIVRQTAEDYRSIFDASGLQLKIQVPSAPLWVEGDPTRLVQAVGNLLHNAHKFTNPNGLITVSLKRGKDGQSAAITVRDTGIGIDPKILPCVFDVFRQAEQGLERSRGGLGLGLALVKGLVELHHGDVRAASEGAGKGAEFTIHLPIETLPAHNSARSAVVQIPKGVKYRVLVIEDNRDTAESARLLLTLDGYEVQTAYSGSAGLEAARSFRPQIVLCDIGLPGMDGYQVARIIRQDATLSSAYVIALTGYGRDEDQRHAHEAGFDMHLTKPIDYNNLRRALAYLPARAH